MPPDGIRYAEVCPCGCELWNEGPVHVLQPCSPDCDVAAAARRTLERWDATVETRPPLSISGRDRLEGSDPRPGVPA